MLSRKGFENPSFPAWHAIGEAYLDGRLSPKVDVGTRLFGGRHGTNLMSCFQQWQINDSDSFSSEISFALEMKA